MSKLKQSADPFAALTAAVIGILGFLGLLSKWGVTVDQAAMFGGFLLSAAAAIRTIYARARKDVPVEAKDNGGR